MVFQHLLMVQQITINIDPTHLLTVRWSIAITLNSPQRYDDRQNNANTILSLLLHRFTPTSLSHFQSRPDTLEFILPYFDGWQAYIDNHTYSNICKS